MYSPDNTEMYIHGGITTYFKERVKLLISQKKI